MGNDVCTVLIACSAFGLIACGEAIGGSNPDAAIAIDAQPDVAIDASSDGIDVSAPDSDVSQPGNDASDT